MYRIEVEAHALKELARLRAGDRDRIEAVIDALADNPRPVGCMAVKGARRKGTYRLRIGNYRVIYVVQDGEQVIVVARIARRKEDTYRDLA